MEIVKAYELFHVYFVGKACTQWDKVVQEMPLEDPWVTVNGSLNKGTRKKTWESFLDCIELHKLTIFSCDAKELQWYYHRTRSVSNQNVPPFLLRVSNLSK